MNDQEEIIRKNRRNDFIAQNGGFRNINYYKLSRSLDLHSSANYPLLYDNPQYPTELR